MTASFKTFSLLHQPSLQKNLRGKTPNPKTISMAILATLPNPNLFTNLPTTSPRPTNPSPQPKPPIPIPKYPPPLKSRRNSNPLPSGPPNSPALKTHHRSSEYHKPISPGQNIPLPDGEEGRTIVVGSTGISYQLPGAPFDFMYSYSETPKAPPLALREPVFLPFAPPTMARPWTGKAPMKKSKRNIKLFEPLGADDHGSAGGDGQKRYEMLKAYELGSYTVRPREEVLGERLSKWEIKEMLKQCLSSNRQVNLGRDGLTHNMLELIHTHWRRQPICKVRCLGVPTVDMDNICRCLEEKSGGKIIRRMGGVLYVFRGRNYDPQKRLKLPTMLWKPATPVYPKLIQDPPDGLSKEEADELRTKGKRLLPICKLAKNGVYMSLVRDVRTAFEGCALVKIDCKGMHASDYKKIGAKLKELVPCVLLSFDDEQILMWRGREWKSMHKNLTPKMNVSGGDLVLPSPKMMFLWQRAIQSGKASVVVDFDLNPDDLLSKVEEFDTKNRAIEHSYPASIYSNKQDFSTSKLERENGDYLDKDYGKNGDEYDDSLEAIDGYVPVGSLPVDLIAGQILDGEDEV